MVHVIVAAVLAGVAARADLATAPADQEVLRALPRLVQPAGGAAFRGGIVIVKNRLGGKTVADVTRETGVPVAVRQVNWECVAYWTETTRVGGQATKKERTAVVYLDRNRLMK